MYTFVLKKTIFEIKMTTFDSVHAVSFTKSIDY